MSYERKYILLLFFRKSIETEFIFLEISGYDPDCFWSWSLISVPQLLGSLLVIYTQNQAHFPFSLSLFILSAPVSVNLLQYISVITFCLIFGDSLPFLPHQPCSFHIQISSLPSQFYNILLSLLCLSYCSDSNLFVYGFSFSPL